jgi:hypothetical protein
MSAVCASVAFRTSSLKKKKKKKVGKLGKLLYLLFLITMGQDM